MSPRFETVLVPVLACVLSTEVCSETMTIEVQSDQQTTNCLLHLVESKEVDRLATNVARRPFLICRCEGSHLARGTNDPCFHVPPAGYQHYGLDERTCDILCIFFFDFGM